MSGAPEPEPEPEPELAVPNPAIPVGQPTSESIAAAFVALAPALLVPVNARLDSLRVENDALRKEVSDLRDSATAAAALEPEPEVYYAPDYPLENPHPKRAPTDPLKPSLYDLRGDKTIPCAA